MHHSFPITKFRCPFAWLGAWFAVGMPMSGCAGGDTAASARSGLESSVERDAESSTPRIYRWNSARSVVATQHPSRLFPLEYQVEVLNPALVRRFAGKKVELLKALQETSLLDPEAQIALEMTLLELGPGSLLIDKEGKKLANEFIGHTVQRFEVNGWSMGWRDERSIYVRLPALGEGDKAREETLHAIADVNHQYLSRHPANDLPIHYLIDPQSEAGEKGAEALIAISTSYQRYHDALRPGAPWHHIQAVPLVESAAAVLEVREMGRKYLQWYFNQYHSYPPEYLAFNAGSDLNREKGFFAGELIRSVSTKRYGDLQVELNEHAKAQDPPIEAPIVVPWLGSASALARSGAGVLEDGADSYPAAGALLWLGPRTFQPDQWNDQLSDYNDLRDSTMIGSPRAREALTGQLFARSGGLTRVRNATLAMVDRPFSGATPNAYVSVGMTMAEEHKRLTLAGVFAFEHARLSAMGAAPMLSFSLLLTNVHDQVGRLKTTKDALSLGPVRRPALDGSGATETIDGVIVHGFRPKASVASVPLPNDGQEYGRTMVEVQSTLDFLNKELLGAPLTRTPNPNDPADIALAVASEDELIRNSPNASEGLRALMTEYTGLWHDIATKNWLPKGAKAGRAISDAYSRIVNPQFNSAVVGIGHSLARAKRTMGWTTPAEFPDYVLELVKAAVRTDGYMLFTDRTSEEAAVRALFATSFAGAVPNGWTIDSLVDDYFDDIEQLKAFYKAAFGLSLESAIHSDNHRDFSRAVQKLMADHRIVAFVRGVPLTLEEWNDVMRESILPILRLKPWRRIG